MLSIGHLNLNLVKLIDSSKFSYDTLDDPIVKDISSRYFHLRTPYN